MFAVIGNSVQPLDAPVQSLSSVLKINPLDVVTQALPRLPDPGVITGSGVEPKDVPVQTGADQNQKQTIGDVISIPKQIGVVASRSDVDAPSGQVLAQEVAADFDDGEGFGYPVYATSVEPLAVDMSGGGGGVPSNAPGAAAVTQQTQQRAMSSTDYQIEFAKYDLKNNMPHQHEIHTLINEAIKLSNTATPKDQLIFLQFMIKALKSGHIDISRMQTIDNQRAKMAARGIPVQNIFNVTLYSFGGFSNSRSDGDMNLKANAVGIPILIEMLQLLKDTDESGRLYPIIGLGIGGGVWAKGFAMRMGQTAAGRALLAKGVTANDMVGRFFGRLLPKAASTVCSFSPSTPVRTLSGLVAISALSLGTPVLAFNEQTGENGYYPITAVHKNIDPDITYLTITDPEQGNRPEFIETTPEHPFYVEQPSGTQPKPVGHEDLNTHWVGAGHLQIGDKIKQADGTVGVIANVISIHKTKEMFNLTVSEAHTYFVGKQGWLAHNASKPVLTGTERSVLAEATRFFKPEIMSKIEKAYRSGVPTYVSVGSRKILIEPTSPFSGFTDFEGKTFAIGKEAFSSPEELRKTVLHELYRLKTSNSASGLSGAMSASETNSAFKFAEKGYAYLFGVCP